MRRKPEAGAERSTRKQDIEKSRQELERCGFGRWKLQDYMSMTLAEVTPPSFQMYELGFPSCESRAHSLDPFLRCVEYCHPELSYCFLPRTGQLSSENGHRWTLKLLSEEEIHVN